MEKETRNSLLWAGIFWIILVISFSWILWPFALGGLVIPLYYLSMIFFLLRNNRVRTWFNNHKKFKFILIGLFVFIILLYFFASLKYIYKDYLEITQGTCGIFPLPMLSPSCIFPHPAIYLMLFLTYSALWFLVIKKPSFRPLFVSLILGAIISSILLTAFIIVGAITQFLWFTLATGAYPFYFLVFFVMLVSLIIGIILSIRKKRKLARANSAVFP